MIDINEPKNPTDAGCFQDHGYVHDTQCAVREGPDPRYHGREIGFNSIGLAYTLDDGFTFVSIVDVTDKDNPVELALEEYPHDSPGEASWSWGSRWWSHAGDTSATSRAGVAVASSATERPVGGGQRPHWAVRPMGAASSASGMPNESTRSTACGRNSEHSRSTCPTIARDLFAANRPCSRYQPRCRSS